MKTLIEKLNTLEEIKELGNIVMIKLDGERQENQYSVVISSPDLSSPSISLDGDDLSSLLDKAIERFFAENEL